MFDFLLYVNFFQEFWKKKHPLGMASHPEDVFIFVYIYL